MQAVTKNPRNAILVAKVLRRTSSLTGTGISKEYSTLDKKFISSGRT